MNDPPRPLIVDTDTGSDDVWAIIEALRAVDIVRVEAITTVCGNLPLDLCAKNAIHAAEIAGTYVPPVYRGMTRPIMSRASIYAADVHGADGLGGMYLPDSKRRAEREHAVAAIVRLAREYAGKIEIVTCGPLTNLAMAVLLAPEIADAVKRVWILGGSAGSAGNMTPAAEYNVFVDPEAAAIVLDAGMDTCWVTWDAARGGDITPEDTARMESSASPVARFCARCTRQLRQFYREKRGSDHYAIVDAAVMTAALYPETMVEVFPARCSVTLARTEMRGHFTVVRAENDGNCTICTQMDSCLYKKKLFQLIGMP